MAGLLLFGLYPQATFPRLNIVATRVPGYAVGDTGEGGERFLNNKRIDGTLFEQLEGALDFCAACMRVKTIIDPKTARREDVTEYPLEALRELLLNALLHRDYSVHTVSTPITIQFFSDRVEVVSPGGIFGRFPVNRLGEVHPDTRNPVLVSAFELYGVGHVQPLATTAVFAHGTRIGFIAHD